MVGTRQLREAAGCQAGRKKILMLLIVISLTLLVLTAYARTTITQTGCEALVKVKIALYGPGANETQILGWETAAENLWNGPRGSQVYGDCKCRMKFDFEMQIVANAAACPADAHCIEVKRVGPAGSHRPYVVPGDSPADDFFNGPYTGQRTGEFSDITDGRYIAHEIGHLMGLPDEYFEFTANYTVHANGSITLHSATVTYPRGRAVNDAYREKILELLRRRLAAGTTRANRSYVEGLDGLTPGASNTTIMGQEQGFVWVAEQYHIAKITGTRRVNCPNICCCGNGVIEHDKGEECDRNATPTGCPDARPICTQQCKCNGTVTTSTTTSSTLMEGISTTTLVTGGGEDGGGTGGTTGGEDGDGTGTAGSPTTTLKPECSTSSDCGELTTKKICKSGDVYEQKTTPLCQKPGTPEARCISKLKDTIVEDCGEGFCVNAECVEHDPGPPGCCDCPGDSCYSGAYIFEADCPQYCSPASGEFYAGYACSQQTGNCVASTTTTIATTSTTLQDYVPTCADRGMHSTQSACQAACQSPSYCTYSEAYGCWYCKQVVVTCGEGLYSSSSCNGACNPSKGEQCTLFQGGPCYYCYCGKPDLIVSHLSASIHKSASTQCSGEVCQTTCSMTASVEVKVRNVGPGSAGSSTASVSISPGVGTKTQAVSSLGPYGSGDTSSTYTLSFSKEALVSGSGTAACSSLSWWASAYTVTATADSTGAVSECSESNNQNSVSPSITG